MLWIQKNVKHEQMLIQFSDLTAAVLHFADWHVMVVSVYIEPEDAEELKENLELLDSVIKKTREKVEEQMKVVLTGDFNWHDKLWEGNDIEARQGKADWLIKFMNQHSLQSLLQRDIKTWHNSSVKSMIDLVLVSEELASNVIKCMLHNTNYDSDHEAIKTTFNVAVPE